MDLKKSRFTREDGTEYNLADVISDLAGTFGSWRVAERSAVFELKSIYGISALRDVTATAGSGTVSHAGVGSASEYTLATTASGSDSATLDTAERGRYQAGANGEAGIGVRLASATLTGSQVARWGYFDDNNGFLFGLDAAGFFVAIRRGGTDEIIRQADFNGYTANSINALDPTLDLTSGTIFQIVFSWYGYGSATFQMVKAGPDGRQRPYTLHRFQPTGETSTLDPNLPVRAQIENGGTATAQTMYVGGRQFAVVGKFDPSRRINGVYRTSTLGSVGETFLPVATFRRKSAFLPMSVKIGGFDLIADQDLYWQIRSGGTLTGASYATPPNTTAAETACEVDTTASAITGGEIYHPGGIIPAATNQARTFAKASELNIEVPGTEPITLCVRRVSGTGASVTAAALNWREEW